ncbi:MAG: ABC transporter permease [Alphaproteobacteria bacterium]|nr:ABC transporter permease [Alphaproteobacteria bacterium]
MKSISLRSVKYRLHGAPLTAIAFMILVVFAAAAAPLLTQYSPVQGSLFETLRPPVWEEGGSWAHIFGTDRLGRDIWARLLYGAQASVSVALIAIFVAGSMGTAVGIIAGYFGGIADSIIMRGVDLMLSMPLILMAFVFSFVWGPSFGNVILVLVLFLWAQYARQARGEVLSIKEREYVTLATIAGASHLRIILRHIFPNIVNTLIVLAMLQVGRVILLEASLSFLGVGLPPPQPAWGLMVAEGRGLMTSAWWISAIPGVAIVLTIVSLNLLGDWLRDVLDPKLR